MSRRLHLHNAHVSLNLLASSLQHNDTAFLYKKGVFLVDYVLSTSLGQKLNGRIALVMLNLFSSEKNFYHCISFLEVAVDAETQEKAVAVFPRCD